MVISREDAAGALRDVELTQARTRDAHAYERGSMFMFIWGAVWIVGYTLTGLVPPKAITWVWIILPLIGIASSIFLRHGQRRESWRWFAAFAAVFCFVGATYAIMRPIHGAQYEIYPVLCVALAYVFYGLARLTRYLWIGGAIFILGLIGYFYLEPWLPFWLALVGGGGLILSGFWLRKA